MSQAATWPGRELPDIGGIVSDLDGVVYRGAEPIPSAIEAFADWHGQGTPYCFVTNNSTRTPEAVAAMLGAMGVHCTPHQVVTSATGTAAMLRRQWPSGGRAYVLGAPSLVDAVAGAGFEVGETEVDCVVVGLDRALTYDRMSRAVQLVLNGAVLIGTNPDLLLPTANGFEPGAGALLTAIATSSGREPVVIGKPQPQLIHDAVAQLGVPYENVIMLGDQVATDIVAAQRAGVFAVLVQTGVPAAATEAAVPDLTVPDLNHFRRLLAR